MHMQCCSSVLSIVFIPGGMSILSFLSCSRSINHSFGHGSRIWLHRLISHNGGGIFSAMLTNRSSSGKTNGRRTLPVMMTIGCWMDARRPDNWAKNALMDHWPQNILTMIHNVVIFNLAYQSLTTMPRISKHFRRRA